MELKPCPFCGCADIEFHSGKDDELSWAECTHCNAQGKKIAPDDKPAIEYRDKLARCSWNNRVNLYLEDENNTRAGES